MGQPKNKVKDLMTAMQIVQADDPDMIEKLNLIARKIAEAQGKIPATAASGNNSIEVDPMEELGCEGCQ
jgi:hypothetical protein